LAGSNESPDLPFLGEVKEGSFKIWRDIKGRNSFLPLMHGEVIPAHRGSRVKVVMIPHAAAILFIFFWLAYAVFFGIGAVSPDEWMAPEVVGLVVFAIGLVAFCFFPEALGARKILEEKLRHGS
jgi:hypothetical protein